LAWLGWQDAPTLESLLTVGRVAILLRVFTPLQRSRREGWFYLLVMGFVLIPAVLMPRFWLVPKLPGDLETAAMAPIHLLVFAKLVILALVGGALMRMWRTWEPRQRA
ncbi:MAG: hypothetical protein D6740_07830, partial [Alphaproteobacteria bacterium]